MRALRITAALFFVASLGCGKETSDQNISDAGTNTDASNLGDAGIKPFSGQISIKQFFDGGAFQNGGVAATFAKTTADTCTTLTSGACTYSDCSNDVMTGVPADFSAGTISVSGGQLAATKVLTYNVSLQNYSADLLAPAFQVGDEFEIHATGADVTAFEGTSATAPANITLSSPAAPDGGFFVLDESHDLVVSWSGASTGSTTDVLVESEGPKQIECTFDGASGSGTIASSLLQKFGTLVASDEATIIVLPQAVTTLQSENASVTVLLQASGAEVAFTSP